MPCKVEDSPQIPYELKVAVMKDTAWSSMLKGAMEEKADLKELVDDVDDDEAGDTKRQGKKRKRTADDAKKGKAAKFQTKEKQQKTKLAKNKHANDKMCIHLPPPEYEISIENVEDCEPFVHNDLHKSVVQQACHEWSAKALVVWTLGAGSAVLAGILGELPTVGLALCDNHLLMVAHVIDSEIANRMQVDFKGNKLYDADLHQRAMQALGGDSESEQKKKDIKKKGEDKAVDNEGKAKAKSVDEDDDYDDDDDHDHDHDHVEDESVNSGDEDSGEESKDE
jgi:hypothetical protein